MAASCVLRPTIEIFSRGCLSELPITRLSNGWLAVPVTGANDPRTGRRRATRKRRGLPDGRPFFSDFGGSRGADPQHPSCGEVSVIFFGDLICGPCEALRPGGR